MKFNSPDFEKKIALTVENLPHLPRPIVFTNGCFDVLHAGHVTYLAQAKTLGKTLIVALNTDESVKRLGKGNHRPFNPLKERMQVVAALESVDAVLSFDDDTPLFLIQKIRPDVLVKGGDWSVEKIVGADVVVRGGGKVFAIPFLFATSTTKLANKIKKT